MSQLLFIQGNSKTVTEGKHWTQIEIRIWKKLIVLLLPYSTLMFLMLSYIMMSGKVKPHPQAHMRVWILTI